MTDHNNEFSQDELEAPSWLNKEFLQQVLSNYEKDGQLKVNSIKISPATVKGDHYASVMFRVAVDYSNCRGNTSKSLIIKTMPEVEGFKREQLGDSHIFRTEIGMYTEVLPKFEAILREIGDETKFCLQCIYHSLEPRQVMIFEDLVPMGYTVVRDREPTMAEIKSVYVKLAKWHAVSYKLSQDQPNIFEKFKYSVMELPKIAEDPFMDGIKYFIRLLDEVPDLQCYKPYFEKMLPNYEELFRASMVEHRENRQENAYYVLCHGDLYVRNMLFKHNGSTDCVEDCMPIDFQMSNVGPMPNDIIYSIYQMLSPDQRQNHRDELIEFYFANFTDTLKKLHYKGDLPLMAEFRKQMFRHRYLELFLLTTFLPLIYSVKCGKYKTEDAVEMRYNTDLRQNLYRIEGYVSEVRSLLKLFVEQKYFE